MGFLPQLRSRYERGRGEGMSYRKHLMTSDEPPSELYKAVELGTNLAEVGTDCISRQAAIDTLRGYLVGKRCPDDGTLTCRLIENEVINKLPPAQPKLLQPWEVLAAQAVLSQPEIIRCKDCKHRDEFGCCKYWVGLTMGMPTTATDDDDFCSHAERSKT